MGVDKLFIRLIGSTVDKNIGKSVQHTNSFDHYEDSAKEWLNAHYRNLFDTPAGVMHDMTFNFQRKALYVQKFMHLPLCDEKGICKFLISTFEKSDINLDISQHQPRLICVEDFSALRTIDIGAGPGQTCHGLQNGQMLDPIKI